MTTSYLPPLSRRRLLQTAAAGSAATIAPKFGGLHAETASAEAVHIRPVSAEAAMVGDDALRTRVWAYNGTVPGPVLRARQDTSLQATVENGLPEGTTVHWHGIRLPNAMDGVPGLTQPTIQPGARFDYAFTPPDAGTFWYHSHDDSLVQMGRGLAGALIVEEPSPPAVDRELLWAIQDWRLDSNAQIAPGFDNRMEEAMDGRVGNTVTIDRKSVV